MLPKSRSFTKPSMTVYIPTPSKYCPNFPSTETQPNIQKLKFTSFTICPSSTHSQFEKNRQFFTQFNQHERSSTPQFHPTSPAQLKNRSIQLKSSKGSMESNQKSCDSKNSHFSIDRGQVEKRKSEMQSHTQREYIKNKIPNFESLRSTITIPHSNLQNLQPPSLSRKSNTNGFQTPILEYTREKIFSMYQNCENHQSKHLLQPLQASNMGSIKSNQSLEKDDNLMKSKFQKSTQKIPYINFLERRNDEFSINSQQLKQNVYLNLKKTNDKSFELKKETRVPSFISSRVEKKESKHDQKSKSQQFPKIFPSNMNCQRKKEQAKPVQAKILSTNKHSKSFSVFEKMGLPTKRSSQQFDFSSTAGSFSIGSHLTPKGSIMLRQKSISFPNAKIHISEPRQLELSKGISSILQNRAKIVSASLRQSMDKLPLDSQQLKKEFDLELKQRQSVYQGKRSINQVEKPFFLHVHKTISNPNTVQYEKIHQKRKKESPPIKLKNSSAIDDIKQTLISCDLFSQQDYKGVFEIHKKDLLHLRNSQNNEAKKFLIKIPVHKTSLKDLVEFSDAQSRLSFEEERKLVELAEMCEQKRSKWILEQTDTIKQSLKELSEYNTEKSLYDNEWKKIQTRDFSPRNNHRNFTICEDDDEIRDDEMHSELKKQSKISSIRLIQQDQIDQSYGKMDYGVRFIKGKQRSLNVNISRIEHEQKGQQRFGYVSLDDFDIKWCSEEPIMGNSLSQENKKTYVTYSAKHKQTNLLYTIKKFLKSTLKQLGESIVSSFIRKVKIQMLTINHPNVEKVYTIFSDKNSIYLVCEFTENKLSDILSQNSKEKMLDSSEHYFFSTNLIKNENNRILLFREIIDGLEEIHVNHIVHKGVQPNNIRILFDTCKLSGFDNAQFVDQAISKVCNEYICPQVLFDSSKLAMDIWCLGILAFELLVGRKPFELQNEDTTKKFRKILECNFNIPVEKAPLCEEILNSALRRNPNDRASIIEIKKIWTRKFQEYSHYQARTEQAVSKLMAILKQ